MGIVARRPACSFLREIEKCSLGEDRYDMEFMHQIMQLQSNDHNVCLKVYV